MAKQMKIVPKGWPCKLYEVRGLFLFDDELCMASAYNDAYIVETGDAFWGGAKGREARGELMVQPVALEVVDD